MPIIEKETFEYSLNEVRMSLLVLFVWEIRTFRFADYTEIAYINDILSNKWILRRLRGGAYEEFM